MRSAASFLCASLLAAASSVAQDNNPPITRIAFGSCNREYRSQVIWKAIRGCKPQVWIWLGDIVYGSVKDLANLRRRYETEKNQPDYTALRQECRIIGTWDDNDYGVSDGGRENPHKIESQQLLLDFLDEPANSARRKQAGVYTSYVFGPAGRRIKIILLDLRYHREKPGPKADLLGRDQWQWLEQELRGDDADVNIIGSSIQFVAFEQPYEKWQEFPQSRQRLLDLIAETKARNVIVISGDRHLGEISRLTDPAIPYPIYDITSSGLTHHAKDNLLYSFTRETNHFRVGNNFVGLNFGLIEFDWTSTPAVATLQIRDQANSVRAEAKVILSTR